MSFLTSFLGLAFFQGTALAFAGIFAVVASVVTPRYPNAGEFVGGTATWCYGLFLILSHLLALSTVCRFIWISL